MCILLSILSCGRRKILAGAAGGSVGGREGKGRGSCIDAGKGGSAETKRWKTISVVISTNYKKKKKKQQDNDGRENERKRARGMRRVAPKKRRNINRCGFEKVIGRHFFWVYSSLWRSSAWVPSSPLLLLCLLLSCVIIACYSSSCSFPRLCLTHTRCTTTTPHTHTYTPPHRQPRIAFGLATTLPPCEASLFPSQSKPRPPHSRRSLHTHTRPHSKPPPPLPTTTTNHGCQQEGM